jgi:hypothetical protein
MACKVDMKEATRVAVRILSEYGVWERPLGLVGVSGKLHVQGSAGGMGRLINWLVVPVQVWGNIVREWLDEVLPENAAEICSGRVHISVVQLPFRRHFVSQFHSKTDLIDTCLASAHLPVIMNGRCVSA